MLVVTSLINKVNKVRSKLGCRIYKYAKSVSDLHTWKHICTSRTHCEFALILLLVNWVCLYGPVQWCHDASARSIWVGSQPQTENPRRTRSSCLDCRSLCLLTSGHCQPSRGKDVTLRPCAPSQTNVPSIQTTKWFVRAPSWVESLSRWPRRPKERPAFPLKSMEKLW